MSSGTAIKQGFSLARKNRAAVWVLFLVNLGLAALAGLPIYRGVLTFTGHSLASQALAYGFSIDWLTDFSSSSPGSLDRYGAVVALVGLVSIPVNSVLAGGVMARFREPERVRSLEDFFHDTARYAWRLLRLLMIGLVCYWIVFRVLNQGLGRLATRWTRDWLDDRPIFWARLGVGVLLFLAVGLVNLSLDFARVKLVMEDGSSAIEAFLSSLGFALAHLGKAMSVYAFPSLGGLALLGLYGLAVPWQLLNTVPPEGSHFREPIALALLFFGQQAAMLGRYWFRVAAWASEWSFYRGFRSSKIEIRNSKTG